MRAVPVPVGDLLALDEALGLGHPVLEIGVGQVHARVEDGDLDALAGQPRLPGRGRTDLGVAGLHRGVDPGVQPDLLDAAGQTHSARSRAARPGGDVRGDRAPELPGRRRLQSRTAHTRQTTDLAGSVRRGAPGVLRVRHDERQSVGGRVIEPLLDQSGDVEEFGVQDARLEVGPGLVGYDGDPAAGHLAANRSGRALGTLHGDRLPACAEVGHGHLVTGDQGDGSCGGGCVYRRCGTVGARPCRRHCPCCDSLPRRQQYERQPGCQQPGPPPRGCSGHGCLSSAHPANGWFRVLRRVSAATTRLSRV